MADEGKPPVGRGSGPGRGSQRKAKFAPTVPSQRRKKADEAGPSGTPATAAEAAAANEAFQDLIRAAQTESKWQRGRGRGFGRGRGGAATTVMFGGDGHDMRRTAAAAPPPRAPPLPKGEGKAGAKEKGAGSSSSKRRLKPSVKSDGKAEGGSESYPYGDDEASGSGSDEYDQDLATLFDYEQYYPTTLPLPLHHPCDEEADADSDRAIMRQGLPQELALKEDDAEGATAAQLGLTDLSVAADTLYLFQLPSILPLGVPAAEPKNGRTPTAAAAAGSSSSQQQLRATTVREVPSGPIGKLLVFKSGRVKLQMGPCLMDVSAGMPCVSRQDVAAINKSTGHLIQLGPVTQRAVVCPDVWQLMASQETPEFRRDLQQQGVLTNGFGRGEGMDVDGEGELEDDLGVDGVTGGVKGVHIKKQQVIGSEEEGSDEGGGEQPAVKQEQQPPRVVQHIGSSSEDGSPEPAAVEAVEEAKQPQQSAAAAVPPKQPVQQQQPAGNGALGWLDLPAAPRSSAAGRGRGRFRPTTRSPSPAAAMAPGAAAAGGVKQEDAMDVDS